jgi:hypothetical protein
MYTADPFTPNLHLRYCCIKGTALKSQKAGKVTSSYTAFWPFISFIDAVICFW